MLKKLSIAAVTALSFSAGGAMAAGEPGWIENIRFSFQGPFGTYDQAQLQRGLQVYSESCAACHGLQYVPLRTLADRGGPMLSEDQVRAYAAQFEIFDPEIDDWRDRTPNDHFPMSALENAPDLSVMAKARAGFHGPYGTGINQLIKGMGGAEYIYSLIIGYTGEEREEAGAVFWENKAYPDEWIAMAPPLMEGQIEFADGREATVRNMAEDVAAFLMWTAEPKLADRKQAGLTGVLFLTVLSVLLYLTNKRIWAPVKGKKKS
jgi:ubiquinol-cytochrome c reductase cytochrome c1 subunit